MARAAVAQVDVDETNGPEVWPGSHRVLAAADKGLLQDEGFLAQRRAVAPPVRAAYPRGSICLKDNRIWHRGAPNTSGKTLCATLHAQHAKASAAIFGAPQLTTNPHY